MNRPIKNERKQRAGLKKPKEPGNRPRDVSVEIEHPGLEREATPINTTSNHSSPQQPQRRKSSGKQKTSNNYQTKVNLCTDISCNVKVMSMCFVVLIIIAISLGLIFGLRRRR